GEITEISLCLPEEYSDGIEKKIDRLNTQVLLRGYCLEEFLSEKELMQKVKDNFRELVRAWIYKGVIIKRAYEKPLGYPGDYKMAEIIYDNTPVSKNIGVYLDAYFLKSPYAVAARMRKDHFNLLLRNHIAETVLNRIPILSFGCGPCREIRELLLDLKAKGTVVFTCLDGDPEPLNFSNEAISKITCKNVEFKFIEEGKIHILENQAYLQPLGRQSLIYSVDSFDYLPDGDFKVMLYALYELLQKDGKLIFSHANREKTFPPVPLDWFCDWQFIPRNKGEVVKLISACGISGFSLSVDPDDFEYIHYFTLKKNK
ncbi:MAG: hypothetical protein PHC33_01100, partial [Candidatus Omnitrophica bacterium]|nr:hypothetical protein [Candidatus Omnitrophota bacterium]